ncbi:hypothetical protein B0T18DRAFT_392948 [Schizothecium vesticola]|uniref:Uncharacterized protein n=1 Tax=Schizothecium vesticola TaxID=314040 RepID=A0AA40BTE5_9PEZI|nr:hypothetical protein B0T18DRAFT_392948 [Schizothecium vesticola]
MLFVASSQKDSSNTSPSAVKSGEGALPSVHAEVFIGFPKSDDFYLILANVPEGTTWHHVKDFLKGQADLELDTYINLHGVRNDSGWIRVVGYRAFRQVKRIFQQSIFRGQQAVVRDPGYQR